MKLPKNINIERRMLNIISILIIVIGITFFIYTLWYHFDYIGDTKKVPGKFTYHVQVTSNVYRPHHPPFSTYEKDLGLIKVIEDGILILYIIWVSSLILASGILLLFGKGDVTSALLIVALLFSIIPMIIGVDAAKNEIESNSNYFNDPKVGKILAVSNYDKAVFFQNFNLTILIILLTFGTYGIYLKLKYSKKYKVYQEELIVEKMVQEQIMKNLINSKIPKEYKKYFSRK